MSYLDRYFELEQYYRNHYGNNVILLRESNMFYEIFQRNDFTMLLEISRILHTIVTTIYDDGDVKIYVTGFLKFLKDQYIRMLVDNGAIIVIVDYEWGEKESF